MIIFQLHLFTIKLTTNNSSSLILFNVDFTTLKEKTDKE